MFVVVDRRVCVRRHSDGVGRTPQHQAAQAGVARAARALCGAHLSHRCGGARYWRAAACWVRILLYSLSPHFLLWKVLISKPVFFIRRTLNVNARDISVATLIPRTIHSKSIRVMKLNFCDVT